MPEWRLVTEPTTMYEWLMQPGCEVPDLSVTHNGIVADAIDNLTPKHRMVIEAIYFERLSYGQLAKRMGEEHVPPRTYSRPYVFRLTRKAVIALCRELATHPHLIERYGLDHLE